MYNKISKIAFLTQFNKNSVTDLSDKVLKMNLSQDRQLGSVRKG